MDKKEMDKRRSGVLHKGEVLHVRYVGKTYSNFFNGAVMEAKPRMCHKSGLPYPEPKWVACCYEIEDSDGDTYPVAEERYGKLKKGFEWVHEDES